VIFAPLAGHFRLCRHRVPAAGYRVDRLRRFQRWKGRTGAPLAV
jgi:hypothetical protein